MKDWLRTAASGEGFEAMRVTRPAAIAAAGVGLDAFLKAGHNATMAWLAAAPERRASPARLWPEARSIIVFGANYGPAGDPLDRLRDAACGVISVYALGDDYHDVIKKKLKRIAGGFHRAYGHDVKVFVDTAPVMEKPLAEAAGVGWQGRHTNLVSRKFGSWLFLGSIFTTASLPPDEPETDHCGSCRACLDICPTAAFVGSRKLDARRCISYLTIEHKGHISAELRDRMGNRIYGCDDCLAICPWNKYARAARERKFHPRDELIAPALGDLAALDDAGFRALFAKSPVKRTGRDRFVRNVLIAIGNSDDPALAESAEALLGDGSVLVRAMAVWALSRLLDRSAFEILKKRHERAESDADVRAEWVSGLGRPDHGAVPG